MNLQLDAIDLPIRIRTERGLTDDELLEFSRANHPAQVERDANGELIVMSPNFTQGGAIEGDVYAELRYWARDDGRGKTFGPNCGFKLPDTSVRAPDASWVGLERWNALCPAQQAKYAEICPDFVIEVRSEEDRLPAVQKRMVFWLANGAELGWLIDPQRKVVEIDRPGQTPEVHENPTSVQGTGCVSGFCLVMERVWG